MSLTTRGASSVQEERVAKKLGGHVSPNSGAGRWEKGDVKIPEANMIVECKTCISPKKSYSIKKEWIKKGAEESFISRMYHHVIAFNFCYEDKDDYYVIDDKLMRFLVDKLSEESE